MRDYAIVLVASASHALRAEALLKAQGMPCKVIPVPRWLSSDCGVCVRVLRRDATRALEILDQEGVVVRGLRNLEDGNLGGAHA
ncbi:MAG: DUF3343 domain-containing protein [candidate division KSB1 bacterium]|nr:DUF3343 domain-containing protein [candidate division KSB1 bacterium]